MAKQQKCFIFVFIFLFKYLDFSCFSLYIYVYVLPNYIFINSKDDFSFQEDAHSLNSINPEEKFSQHKSGKVVISLPLIVGGSAFPHRFDKIL